MRSPILVVAPNRELTFVEHDIRILSQDHDVQVLTRQRYPSRRALLPAVLKSLIVRRDALVYLWFAEPHDSPFVLSLARLLRRKCAVATGGYDVTWIPSIEYGSLSSMRNRLKVKVALHAAHGVFPFSNFAAGEVRRLGKQCGVHVIYPGIDCRYFSPSAEPKTPTVLTTGAITTRTWRRKGLDVFAACSKLLPEMRFVIVGKCLDSGLAEKLRSLGGDNLVLTARHVSDTELRCWYRAASVYAQLSAHEGFGVALAEAMACGCVPVASNVGSLPEVVGEAGFLVEYGDVGGAVDAIREAARSNLGSLARDRVAAHYPSTRRERELRRAVSELLQGAA